MKRGGLVTELIVDVDDDGVAHVGFNGRQGPFAVDADGRTGEGVVGIRVDPADVEVVLHDGGPREADGEGGKAESGP